MVVTGSYDDKPYGDLGWELAHCHSNQVKRPAQIQGAGETVDFLVGGISVLCRQQRVVETGRERMVVIFFFKPCRNVGSLCPEPLIFQEKPETQLPQVPGVQCWKTCCNTGEEPQHHMRCSCHILCTLASPTRPAWAFHGL